MVRHGDRAPLRPVRHFDSIPFNSIPDAQLENKFQRLTQTFKGHSFKANDSQLTHFQVLPSSKALGQLTSLGFIQHLHQAKGLADVYLPLKGDVESLIHVWTTSYQRTFQSAVAFVIGFLNQFNTDNEITLVKHAVEKVKSSHGTYFCSDKVHCISCRNLGSLESKLETVKQDLLDMHPAVKSLMQHVIDVISPQNERDSLVGASKDAYLKSSAKDLFPTPESVLDGLFSYICHGSQLPCRDNKCVTQTDSKRLVSFIINRNRGLLNNKDFVFMSMLKVKGFLEHLNDQFSSQHPFLTLFSGHDITLVPVLTVLGLWDGALPPYASRLVFEVYDKNQKLFVRIIYNGRDMTKKSDVCRETSCRSFKDDSRQRNQVTLIPVKLFESWLQRRFISLANTDNFEEACYHQDFNPQVNVKASF